MMGDQKILRNSLENTGFAEWNQLYEWLKGFQRCWISTQRTIISRSQWTCVISSSNLFRRLPSRSKNSQPDVGNTHGTSGNFFCEFACLLLSTLLQNTQFMRWYSCGQKSCARKYGDTRTWSEWSRQRHNPYHEIATKFVGRKFVLPNGGKKFQERWVRPTKTSNFGT